MTEDAAFQPAERLFITSLETLRVFADPLRQQILDSVRTTPRTVKQIAVLLKRQPTKLYYHVKLLEDHGLIRAVDSRIVSGIIEKQYRAAAHRFEIRRTLLLPGSDESEDTDRLDAALDAILNPVRDEIHRGIGRGLIDNHDEAPPHRKLLLRRGFAQLSPAQADAFYARMEALIAEFEAASREPDAADSASIAFRLLIGCFPVERPSEDMK